jgi:hypothetical protein
MSTLLVGSVVGAIANLADDLFTSDKERLDAEIEFRKLGLEARRIDQATDLAQIEVNKESAKSSNWFVAGGRPFIMWVCGLALAYATLIEPIARFVAKVAFGYVGEFPVIDTELTMQLLVGLLGLGGMRSFEKVKGVAR